MNRAICDENGDPVLKKRKMSTKPADLHALRARIRTKCDPDKRKWSDQRYKDHCGNVMSMCEKMIDVEIFRKGYSTDEFALEVFDTIFQALLESELDGYGRHDAHWSLECMATKYIKVLSIVKANVAVDRLARYQRTVERFSHLVQQYASEAFEPIVRQFEGDVESSG